MVMNLEQRRNADSEVVFLLWSKVIILLFLHATNMDLLGEHGNLSEVCQGDCFWIVEDDSNM